MNKLLEKMGISARALRLGTISTAFTASFVALIIILNVAVIAFEARFPVKIDLTSNKLYKLSKETTDYIKSIKEPVSIKILVPEAKFDQTALEIMKRYTKYNNKIEFSVIDVAVNPLAVEKYKYANLQPNGSIIVESGDRYRVLDVSDLYEYEGTSGQEYVVGLRAEQKLTSAFISVLSKDAPTFLFSTGHGETVTEQLKFALTENNFIVKNINLTTDKLPEGARFLVINAPTSDMSAEELLKIDQLVAKGKTAVYVFLTPQAVNLPVLFDYLNEWGIKVNKDIVIDTDPVRGGTTNLTAQVGASKLDVPNSRSLTAMWENNKAYTLNQAAGSLDTAYAKDTSGGQVVDFYKDSKDKKGPFLLSIDMLKTMGKENIAYKSHMMVFGSSDVISDAILTRTSNINLDFFLNKIYEHRQESDLVYVTPKYYNDLSLYMPQGHYILFFILFVVVLPLLFGAFGIAVFYKRKNL